MFSIEVLRWLGKQDEVFFIIAQEIINFDCSNEVSKMVPENYFFCNGNKGKQLPWVCQFGKEKGNC